MDKKRAIELLIQAVDEIPHLKTLHYQNDEIKLWLDKVGNILRAGLKPEDYSKYWPVSQELEILKGIYEDNIYQEEYLRKITDYELALKSILLKYEVVGMEGKRDKGGEVEMDKKEAIQFLKERLGEIPYLAKLNHDNQDYPLWRNQIEDVLEAIFGRDLREYQRFAEAHPSRPRTSSTDRSAEKRWYLDELKMRETAILSIIKTHELLGVEDKPVEKTQQKDTVKLPIQLFDALQFHPRVIEVSKSLFVDGYYKQAILEAYIALNNLVKDKAGSTLDGKALMAEVFSEKAPIIKLNDLLDRNDKDEQEGFKFLYMGAIVGVRNPKAHDNIVQSDPYRTLEYLSLVSLLMKRVDEGKVVKL